MELSIIIPVYNAEKYLKQCLNSIINPIANKKNIELIIIDDGSVDSSSKIYNSYNYDWIKKIKIPNKGVSNARNLGIKKSSGKWIMFVDADDTLCSNWYSIISKYFNSNNDIVYFFDTNNIDNKNRMSKNDIYDCMFGVLSKYNYKYFAPPWSKIFKREKILDNHIDFKLEIINGEDLLFNLKALAKCNHYCISNDGFYNYRISNTSVTKSFNKNIFSSDKKFHEELERLFIENNIPNYIFYSNLCIRNAIKLFFYRLSLINNKELNKYLDIFKQEPYKKYIKDNKKDIISLASKYPKVIINFYKLKKILAKRKLKVENYFIKI